MVEAVSENIEELLHGGYRYALSLTHDKASAEDIVQDAWVSVLKANGPHTRPYLFSAVRSRFLNANKREQLISMVSLNEVSSEVDLDDTLFDATVGCHLEQAMLDKALNDLRSVEREALFLMAVEGYTASEISSFTQQPRGTVLSHIHRAKRKIKELIETHYPEVAP